MKNNSGGYELKVSPVVKKFIKKLNDKPLKSKFRKAFEAIQLNPFEVGEVKRGDLAGIFGYDIYHNGINYEIAYTITAYIKASDIHKSK